jgi:hypothetical protein
MNLSRLFVPGLSLLFFSGVFIAGVASCRHNDDITNLSPVCFDADILPIFQTNCAISGCHDGGGEVNLSTYNGIMNGITAGSASKSRYYTVMTNPWSLEMMPPDRPVSLENRTKIKVWIEQGAKPTTCP